MQDKLKPLPCRFCKDSDVVVDNNRDFTIKCTSCFQLKIQCCQSKEEAIQKWNMVNNVATDKTIETLVTALKFYANEDNWNAKIYNDEGKTAEVALASVEGV